MRVIAIIILGFVALIGGLSAALHRAPWQIVAFQFTPTPQELFGKQNALVLVEGLDYDYNGKDIEYSKNSRSDVIWAVNLDFATKHIYQLSIPRDMVATLPNGTQAKINQAQSDGGVREAQTVISKWLGIPGFDRYMVFRVDTTKDLINALGGVNVNVMNSDCITSPKNCTNGPLDYEDTWGHLFIHLKPGMQHLNGDQAVGYMRYRHDWCGDPCRIKRQQEVLHALFAKLSSDKVNTLMHANDLIGVLNKDVDTNLSREEEISLAAAFVGMPKDALVTNQVPYVAEVNLPDYGDSIVPDTVARAKLVDSMLLNPPAPSPDPGAVAAIAPSSVKVDVQNGSGIPGEAKKIAAQLQHDGFVIAAIGNAPRSDMSSSEVHQHSSIALAAARVRQALGPSAGNARLILDGTGQGASDVTVIVGQDLATQ